MARFRFLLAVISTLMLAVPRLAAADFMVLWSNDNFNLQATATLPMAVGDMNGDNIMEIVGRNGNTTEVRDAMTGALHKQFPAYVVASAYAMADLNGDGTPECICSGEGSKTFIIDWVLVSNAEAPPAPSGQLNLDIHPNPGFGGAEIGFTLAARTNGELRIYDPSGRSVRVVADRAFEAGKHAVSWDGRDERGARLSPGIYFVELRLNDGGISHKGKIVLN